MFPKPFLGIVYTEGVRQFFLDEFQQIYFFSQFVDDAAFRFKCEEIKKQAVAGVPVIVKTAKRFKCTA